MKFLLKFFIGGITLFLLAFVTIYLFTSGEYFVPKTVVSDDSLPSIEINDKKLYVESYGDTTKPLLVVLHGGPGFDSKYMKGFSTLSDSFHVVLYDQLGCGLSERVNPDEISMEIQLENLNEILLHYKNEKVYLLGHSWGAMLATAFVSKHPEKIQKLVLIEPEFITEETKDTFFQNTNLMRPEFTFKSFSFLAKNWFQSLHIKEPDSQASTDYLMGNYNSHLNSPWHPLRNGFCRQEDKTLEINRFGATASASLVSSVFDNEGNFRHEIFENAKNYKNEVLLLAGGCNKINNNVIQQKHKKVFPNSKLKTLGSAGFFVHLDQPEITFDLIRKFLDKK